MDEATRDQLPPAPRAPRPFRRTMAISLAVLFAVVLLYTGWNAVAYRLLPGPATIGGLHWCGRDYVDPDGARPRTLAQIQATAPYPIQWVGGYPPLPFVGGQLYAAVTPSAQRNSVSPPIPCSMALYLRTGQNQYVSYTLSGGP